MDDTTTATKRFHFQAPGRLYVEARVEAAHRGWTLTRFLTAAVRAYVAECQREREDSATAR